MTAELLLSFVAGGISGVGATVLLLVYAGSKLR